jgi:cytoskeletal protein CcmA (bactofilin family)
MPRAADHAARPGPAVVVETTGVRTEDGMSNGESSRTQQQPGPSPESRSAVDERRMTAWVGKALTVQGKIISAQDLTIDGRVEGTIELGNHGLTIGAGAEIKADLVARTITISGIVIGNVTAADKVVLQATGSVDGDIATPHLVMAEGAVIRGRVEASGKKASSA